MLRETHRFCEFKHNRSAQHSHGLLSCTNTTEEQARSFTAIGAIFGAFEGLLKLLYDNDLTLSNVLPVTLCGQY